VGPEGFDAPGPSNAVIAGFMGDQALVRRMLAGDEQAFDVFFDAYAFREGFRVVARCAS